MNIQEMMKQAQQMQERLQKEMTGLRVEGNAGGGMVTVRVNGAKQVESITITPSWTPMRPSFSPPRMRPATIRSRALAMARENLEEARRSVLDLRGAPRLEGKPLTEALAGLARSFTSDTGVPVQVQAANTERDVKPERAT